MAAFGRMSYTAQRISEDAPDVVDLMEGSAEAPQARRFGIRRSAAAGACLLGLVAAGQLLHAGSEASSPVPTRAAAAAAGPTDRRSIVALALEGEKVAQLLSGVKDGFHTAVQTKINETVAEIKSNIQAQTPIGKAQAFKTEIKNAALNKVGKTAITPEAANALVAKAKKEGWGGDDTAQDLRVASCTLNVLQASNYVARAGVQIDQATKSCRAPDSAYKKEACTADAAGIFSSVAWVATYLSLATSQCAKNTKDLNIPAVCAATIEGFVAALGGLAVQSSFVAANCVANAEETTAENTDTDAVWQMSGRRLQGDKLPADRDSEIATCVLDITEAATALAQMGLNIKAASRSCPLWDYTKNVPIVNGNTHAICSLDIGHILWSVGQAATFIAAATSHCAEGINVKALCAAGITGLASSLAGVVYLGSGVSLACVELEKLGPLKNPVAKELGDGIARRLAAGNATRAQLV